MKLIVNFVLLTILTLTQLIADTTVDPIKWIKKEYKTIRTELNSYAQHKYSFSGESTEGAGGIGYLNKNGDIKLIEVTYYFESGKHYYEFYYSKNSVFFILEREFTYNTNTNMTQELVEQWYKEDGIRNEAFDPKKTTIQEWRYYVSKGKAVRTVDPTGHITLDPKNAALALTDSISNLKKLNRQIHDTKKYTP